MIWIGNLKYNRMKGLSKEEIALVEEYIEPYRDILEDLLTSKECRNAAEQAAWEDFSVDLLVEKLSFTLERAKEIVSNMELYYKTKNKTDEY